MLVKINQNNEDQDEKLRGCIDFYFKNIQKTTLKRLISPNSCIDCDLCKLKKKKVG